MDYYWIGGSGNWSDNTHWSYTSGGASIAPAAHPDGYDYIYFDESSFTAPGQIVNIDENTGTCYVFDWTGALYNPTLNLGIGGYISVCQLTLIPDMSFTSDNGVFPIRYFGIQFLSQSGVAGIINTAGITIPCSCSSGTNTGYIDVVSDLVIDGALHIPEGSYYYAYFFDFNNHNLTCKQFTTSYYHGWGGNPQWPHIKAGTGIWTITGYDVYWHWGSEDGTGVVDIRGAQFCYEEGESTAPLPKIIITDTSTNSKTIYKPGVLTTFEVADGVRGNVDLRCGAVNNILVNRFPGSLILFNIAIDPWNIDTFSVINTSSIRRQIVSSYNPSQGGTIYLTKLDGDVELRYCDIYGIHVQGGANWYACLSTDQGGNAGWIWACSTDYLVDNPYELNGEPTETGVYTLGSHSSNYPTILDLTYPISEREDDGSLLFRGIEIGSILVDGNNVYVTWKRHDHASLVYGIDKINYDNQLNGAYLETQVLSGNQEQFSSFSKFIVSYAHMNSSGSLVIEYSTDYGATWTTGTSIQDINRNLQYVDAEEIESTILQLRLTSHSIFNNAPDVERIDIVLR